MRSNSRVFTYLSLEYSSSRQRSMISAGFQLSSTAANSPFEQYSSKIPASVRGALNHTTGREDMEKSSIYPIHYI